MIAELAAIAICIIAGVPVALAIDPRSRGALLLALSFLYGAGVVYFSMLLHPSLALIVIPLAVIAWRRRVAAAENLKPSPIDLITLLTAIGYATFATIARLWQWDFWAIWGLKARAFFEASGIDWAFLRGASSKFAHADYPLLVPVLYGFVADLRGAWSDRWLGVISVAFAIAVLLVVRSMTASEIHPHASAATTLAAAAFAFTPFVGLADLPLAAFATAAILFLQRDDDRNGALLLGIAANCKNEGLALIATVAIATLLTRPRRLLALWPALALAAPWQILRAMHGLRGDLLIGDVAARASARLATLAPLFAELARAWPLPLLCAATALAFAIAKPREVARVRFVIIVAVLQIAVYVVAYVITPRDVVWHIATSFGRLVSHVAIALIAAAGIAVGRTLERNVEAS
ncbi:MAG TPA: hypothetical protein VMU84_18790 [Thermoanaerobaculia bacterium]|nr:hypothetical protein [Thermoanaerobaculia bacterium]